MIKRAFALLLTLCAVGSMTMISAQARTPAPELTLGRDGDTRPDGGLLEPGMLYRFPILLEADGFVQPLTRGAFEIRSERLSGGEDIERAGVVIVADRYYFDVQVRADATLRRPAAYELTYTEGGERRSYRADFYTGYPKARISHAEAGVPLQVDLRRPYYTAAQLAGLAALNGDGTAHFAGDGWAFRGRVRPGRDANFAYHTRPVQAVRERYPDAAMQVLAFPRGGSFTEGALTVTLDSDLFGEGRVYAYRYLYGRLYRMPATHTPEEGTITLQVNNLGAYIFTDLRIPEATVVG